MNVRQIVRVSDQGVSQPYLCYDENGVLRWCKGNHTGLRSLISEWVCARIARKLGLPVPACDILRLDPTLFRDWSVCQGGRVPQLVTEWTEVGCEVLSLDEMKGVLLGEAF